jgi:hypothetical protein
VPRDVPRPLERGYLVGLRFPTSDAPHPHPGLIIEVFGAAERDRLAAARGLVPEPDHVLCLMLMISHSAPPRGEPGDFIQVAHRAGTRLDPGDDLFMCYRHFDVALLPRRSPIIGSVGQAYLGRMPEQAWTHYRAQFHAVQA